MIFISICTQHFFLLLKGLCDNSQIDWNYYLTSLDGEVFYEGYINEQWKNAGNKWKTSNNLMKDVAFVEMNPAENSNKYPVGFFLGDMYDPNV